MSGLNMQSISQEFVERNRNSENKIEREREGERGREEREGMGASRKEECSG